MIDIWVVNPNTTQFVSDAIGRFARAVAGSGVQVTAVPPQYGPPSIDSHYDDHWRQRSPACGG